MRFQVLDNLIFLLRGMEGDLVALKEVYVNSNHATDESLGKTIICPFCHRLDHMNGFYVHGRINFLACGCRNVEVCEPKESHRIRL
jgi:hypothetical protein